MSGSVPLLSHTFSGVTEGQFYPFSYSPVVTKNSEVQNELGRLTQTRLSEKNLLVLSCGIGYTKSTLKFTHFV
jgi:hypothetical protein